MSHDYQKKGQKKYKSKYIDKAIRTKCFADLLVWGMFPNSKEVTETFAMYDATEHLGSGYEWNNPKVTCVVVGDGHVPRTGAMFACRTAWTVYSVDPALRPKIYPIDRLTLFRQGIEHVHIGCQEDDNPVLIVLCHSHAKLKNCLEHIHGPQIAVISMDCCVNQQIPHQSPDVVYRDDGVWSPANEIKVWRSINARRGGQQALFDVDAG